MQGEGSCPAKKTFPSVKLENAPQKKIYIKASLYTNETIPRLHVHKLTGKNCDKNNGDCVVELNEDHVAVFQGLGINFTGKKEVNKILWERTCQEFVAECATKGFHVSPADDAQLKERADMESKTMKENLNSVIICFEAFDAEKHIPICPRTFSRSVQNQKSSESGELKISRISACSGACTGDDEVFLLCEKVSKKDIKIRFFEEDSLWENYAHFNEADVHHQVAIVFRTPPYKDTDIQQPVSVSLELCRMKDGERSDPVRFTYRPVERDQDRVAHKRKKLDCSDYSPTTYANPHSFSGSPSVGLRSPKLPGSYSQSHMSPSYQPRGSSQPQESAVGEILEDISDLMTFTSPSSTENSAGVSSSSDPSVNILNPGAFSDEEMSTSTVDQLSPNFVRSVDPMWSVGSSSSVRDDDDTGCQSIYFSDGTSIDKSAEEKMFRSKSAFHTNDNFDDIYIQSGSRSSVEIQSASSVSTDQEFAKNLHPSLPVEQKMPQSTILVSTPRRMTTSEVRKPTSGRLGDSPARRMTTSEVRKPTSGRLGDSPPRRMTTSEVRKPTSGRLGDSPARRMATSGHLSRTIRLDSPPRRKVTSGIGKESQHQISENKKDARVFTCALRSDLKISRESKHQLPVDGRVYTSGDLPAVVRKDDQESQDRRPADWTVQSSPPSRIGTIVLHSRGSTKDSPAKDVRAIVQNVARALRLFLASGDLQLLLYPMRDLMGVTDEDGDNAVHHIALNEGSEPQFVDASLPVVQYLPHSVINQTNNHYQTPLQLAVAVKKQNVLKWLLACGANPNIQDMQGHSALHLSVLKHHHDCLSTLLSKKHKRKLDLNLLNYKGLSPLHMAVLEGCRHCVQSLCAAGADVNTRNGICGRTALHLAVEHRTELLELLLAQENLLVDTQDYAGNTALHLACSEDNFEAALKLMRKEANPLIENFNKCLDEDDEEDENDEEEPKGKTPFDLAKGSKHMQEILAGTVSSMNEEVILTVEHQPNPTSQVQTHSQASTGSSASFPSESASQHISTDGTSRKESTPTFTDSGFISAEIKEDAISRLCERLDPPNTEWKKLAEVLWDDPKQLDQLCKLEKSPTRALLRNVEDDQIEDILRIADLEEYAYLLRSENPIR